jgi:class 3 adenylate cyclase/tetratricopeptide (TPR) repeat protein
VSTTGTLTFLFTDLVGSTEMLSLLGDDAAVNVHRQADEVLRRSITRGQEVKNLGDGLMITFASAVDAVQTAIAMQRGMKDSALGMAVRIGINSGEATPAPDGDYYGTPVVTAQRLCALAAGGQILTSGVVRALVGSRGRIAFESRGPESLKGLPEPVEVYEVPWQNSASAPAATTVEIPYPANLGQPPDRLVGRDDVLSRLDDAWRQAQLGRRGIVLIAGEPGIGKTAAAAVWSRAAFEGGTLILSGRCAPEAVIAYQPFVEVLHQLLSVPAAAALVSRLGQQASELARLVPDLAASLPTQPRVKAEPGTERYLLYEAVVAALQHVARTRSLVIVLDDLHWADGPSIGLLEHWARHPQQSPILIIGTYRETDLSRTHQLSTALAELRRERRFERIHLTGLNATSVAAMVSNRVGADVPVEVAIAISNETEGNPFFVEEVVSHLIENGAIGPTVPWPEPDKVYLLEIPEGIREVVGRRLSRLSEGTNRTLALATVIGREFDGDLLQVLSDDRADEVFDHIDEALNARILTEAPSVFGRYTFSHALIRQTLYEELNPTRRARIHRRVAEVLEARGGASAELARHYTAAHEDAKALSASLVAAREAEGLLALAEAARHYEHALELWSEVENPESTSDMDRPELLLRAAEVTYLLDGGLAPAIDLAREAERTINAQTHPVRAGLIAERLGTYLQLAGQGHDAIAAVERAIALIPADPPSSERAKVLATLAGLLMLFSRNRESEERSLETIEVARSVGDPVVEAHALVTLGTVEGSTGRVEAGVAHILAGRQIAMAERAVNDTLRSYANLSTILDMAGRLEEAVVDALAGSEQAARWHVYGKHYWFPRCNAAWSLIRLGRWDEAGRILESGEAVTEGVSEVFVNAISALLAVVQGRYRDAHRHLDRVFAKSTDIVDPQFQGPIHWFAATLARHEGKLGEAWRLTETGLDMVQKGEDWFYRAPLHVIGCAVNVDLALEGNEPARRRQAAEVLLRALRTGASEARAADFPAQLAEAEAELTRLDGSNAGAWARAHAAWEKLGQPYDASYCLYRQGEALLAAADQTGARKVLERALAIAHGLGAKPLLESIKALKSS